MFCSNCGKKVSDGSKFYQFCRRPVDSIGTQSAGSNVDVPRIRSSKRVVLDVVVSLIALAVLVGVFKVFTSSKKEEVVEQGGKEQVAEVEEVNADVSDGEVLEQEVDTGNNVCYLTEEDIFRQLDSFFYFCWSYSAFNNNRDLGQEVIDLNDVEHCFRSLCAVTVEKNMDVGLISIYETNPSIIVTDEFSEICLSGGGTDLNNLINQCCWNINRIEFLDSNIDKLWHFYEGTDACVYALVQIDTHMFTIEMVQCTGDPDRWLINNVNMRSDQDLFDTKLVNEDSTSIEAEQTGEVVDTSGESDEFLSAYTDYINEVFAEDYILGYNFIYINDDDIPECIVWTTDEYSQGCRAFVLSRIDESVESVTTEGDQGYSTMVGYIPRSGNFWIDLSDWHWSYDDIFLLDNSFHKVNSIYWGTAGAEDSTCGVNGEEVDSNDEEYIRLSSDLESDKYIKLRIDTYNPDFSAMYSTLEDAYKSLEK